jgi:hypothetical protein
MGVSFSVGLPGEPRVTAYSSFENPSAIQPSPLCISMFILRRPSFSTYHAAAATLRTPMQFAPPEEIQWVMRQPPLGVEIVFDLQPEKDGVRRGGAKRFQE